MVAVGQPLHELLVHCGADLPCASRENAHLVLLESHSETVALDARALARLFVEEAGRPFGQGHTQVRLWPTATLLAVELVARRVGYESTSAFSSGDQPDPRCLLAQVAVAGRRDAVPRGAGRCSAAAVTVNLVACQGETRRGGTNHQRTGRVPGSAGYSGSRGPTATGSFVRYRGPPRRRNTGAPAVITRSGQARGMSWHGATTRQGWTNDGTGTAAAGGPVRSAARPRSVGTEREDQLHRRSSTSSNVPMMRRSCSAKPSLSAGAREAAFRADVTMLTGSVGSTRADAVNAALHISVA